jgi:predicted nucleic acid-binding protein
VVLVDTSVWSLLFRKSGPAAQPEVAALQRFLGGEELVAITGVIAQELFYGLALSSASDSIARTLGALSYLAPTLDEHVAAAKLQRTLRDAGVQVSGADALIAQLAMARDLTLLTTDRDFSHAARHVPLRLWAAN